MFISGISAMASFYGQKVERPQMDEYARKALEDSKSGVFALWFLPSLVWVAAVPFIPGLMWVATSANVALTRRQFCLMISISSWDL